MRRRRFLQWLGSAAAALALDPLLGNQKIWGTQPVEVEFSEEVQGFRADQLLESGFVYAPYVPLQMSRPLKEGWKGYTETRRYFRSDYYSTVTIDHEG